MPSCLRVLVDTPNIEAESSFRIGNATSLSSTRFHNPGNQSTNTAPSLKHHIEIWHEMRARATTRIRMNGTKLILTSYNFPSLYNKNPTGNPKFASSHLGILQQKEKYRKIQTEMFFSFFAKDSPLYSLPEVTTKPAPTWVESMSSNSKQWMETGE